MPETIDPSAAGPIPVIEATGSDSLSGKLIQIAGASREDATQYGLTRRQINDLFIEWRLAKIVHVLVQQANRAEISP